MLRKLPIFCETCGKKLSHSLFTTSSKFDLITGVKYHFEDSILVCPDHEKDVFPSGHTREILKSIRVDEVSI